MKNVTLYLAIVTLIAGCASGKIIYDFEMQHPKQSNELFYENDSLSITFEMKPESIGVELYNKLNDGMKISWDEVSVSVNGKAYRIVHKETGILNVNQVQPPTTIPPKSKLMDDLVRTDKIHTGYGMGSNRPIITLRKTFPEYFYGKKEKTQALELKGTQMVIYMPYYIGGKYVPMHYDIFLRDVTFKKQ